MIYFCCDDHRRNAVKLHPTLNGIDFLEVVDNPSDPPERRQRVLLVHFIKPLAPAALSIGNIRIEGGERIRDVKIVRVTAGAITSPPLLSPPTSPPGVSQPDVLTVEVARPGDFSVYTLRLILGVDSPDLPPAGFDPVLSAIDFSFKIGCQGDFDCRPAHVCPPKPATATELDYLSKDYASFRQLMLDRLSVVIPAWQERNAADLGIALVELVAYLGDYLSYQQDAVATEAYLGTARRRVSVRRHARLVDYPMHDGINARTWVYFRLRDDVASLKLAQRGAKTVTALLTQTSVAARIIPRNSRGYQEALNDHPETFELLQEVMLFSAHNEMPFYTWGGVACCLPKGATRATLRGSFPDLKAGDVLVFTEVRGPETGAPEDADPTHRCAVRLTRASVTSDPLGGELLSSPSNVPVPVTEIEWDRKDALPLPVCISAQSGTAFFDDVSIALGNIALADHGMTFESEPLDPVPGSDPVLTPVAADANRCQAKPAVSTPPRFRPLLKNSPVTQAAKFDASAPAAAAVATSAADALPRIFLTGPGGDQDLWLPQRDLLNSGPDEREFVAEVEADGSTQLRFGDDQFGSRPPAGTRFLATYRVGNGLAGNIGADSLYHIVSDDQGLVSDLTDPVITEIRNPLPARGGVEPETIAQVRRYAPSAFRTQERAVIQEDYATLAKRCATDIQTAAATFRWTGSWRTVFLTVDRLGAQLVDSDFAAGLLRCMDKFRMAGLDMEVDAPSFVSLEIEMVVCIKPNYFQSDVISALLNVLSDRVLPNGKRGVFHPDNFTFGQPVYLSPIYLAAQAVDGVASANITKFQRLGQDSDVALKAGRLDVARLEIARLERNPDFPERGKLTLTPIGGK